MNERKESGPCPSIDHRPYGANTYLKAESSRTKDGDNARTKDGSDVSEKDLKTSLNTATKFQEVQKKWSTGSEKSTELNLDLEQVYKTSLVSGSNSVKTLSSRFDYRDNKMVDEEEEELKKILNIQNKQINILKDQVTRKDQRIHELEEQVRILSRHATPVGTPTSIQTKSFPTSPPARNSMVNTLSEYTFHLNSEPSESTQQLEESSA